MLTRSAIRYASKIRPATAPARDDDDCLNSGPVVINSRPTAPKPNPYGIRFTASKGVTWHAKDVQAVLAAAARIASQLRRVMQQQARLAAKLEGVAQTRVAKPAQIFRRVMGPVTFQRVNGSCGEKCWADIFQWPTVRVYEGVGPGMYRSQNATHELGHGFDREARWIPRQALGSKPIEYTDGKGTNISLTTGSRRVQDGFAQTCYEPCTWQGNPERSEGEEFADMFLGWTYNHFASDVYGEARFNWMESHMALWVSSTSGQ